MDDAIQKLAEIPESLCDSAIEAARAFLNSSSGNKNSVISEMVLVLFKVGAVGLRFEGGGGQMWADEHSAPTPSQIKSGTKLLVIPCFTRLWRLLINESGSVSPLSDVETSFNRTGSGVPPPGIISLFPGGVALSPAG
jgi:hypothetical protein